MKKNLIIFIITTILIFMLLVFVFNVNIYTINGKSMQPALYSNNKVVVSSLYYKFFKVKTGDLVLLKTNNGDIVVKRCFLSAGDKVSYDNHFLTNNNGNKIELANLPNGLQNKELLPSNSYYFLGDNLSLSLDSRNYGLLGKENIIGKIIAWRNNE